MITFRPAASVLLVIGGFAAGCGGPISPIDPPPDGREPVDASIDAPSTSACPAANTPINPSLVVNDPTVLARFSFTRVMDQLRASADVSSAQSTRALFQAWMRTFTVSGQSGACNDPTVDPNHFGMACPRGPESKLSVVDPFASNAAVRFRPVGLFNRFDLAPANGANCGEYRIVFAMSSTDPTIGGRGLINFEALLPNPTPQDGIAACLPVAQFWQALGTDPSPVSRAAKLEAFYFGGTAVPGFPPVVAAQSYGLARGATAEHGFGQIRTNFFIDLVEWQLREFKTRRSCSDSNDAATCRLVIEHVTNKANPAEELFGNGHPKSASFQSQFLAQIPRLAVDDPSLITMAPADTFNEYESVSSALNVKYVEFTFPELLSAIGTRLTGMGSTLTATDVLNRATTQTCAGCHQVSNNVALGRGLRWPPSLEFTHIDENHALSQALLTTFLPHRRRVLESFINARCSGAPSARAKLDLDLAIASKQTIGGSAIGAPN